MPEAPSSAGRGWLKIAFCLFSVLALDASTSARVPEFQAPPIAVTAFRLPWSLGAEGRSVTILDRDDIQKLPAVTTVADLLVLVAGVDVKTRSPEGPADISIRGSSFEEVLVLVDGVPVNDPQTGHHNLDLPISLEDVERVEILKGPASSIGGPGAMAGVINIVTRKREPVASGSARMAAGSYSSFSAGVSLPVSADTRVSASTARSGGWRDDTDFHTKQVMLSHRAKLGRGGVGVSAGYSQRKFGANGFYGPYPSYEETSTGMLWLSGSLGPFSFWGGWRGHVDRFTLVRGQPQLYRNKHSVGSVEAGGSFRCGVSEEAELVVGASVWRQSITSTGVRGGEPAEALGSHRRMGGALFAAGDAELGRSWSFAASARADFAGKFGTLGSFSLSASRPLGEGTGALVRMAAATSFRLPSFTELYYWSPANQGNPKLGVERELMVEVGVDVAKVWGGRFSASLFGRRARDLIAWVREGEESPWAATNVGRVEAWGVELEKGVKLSRHSALRFSYHRLIQDSAVPAHYESKYALNPACEKLSAVFWSDLSAWAKVSVGYVHRARLQTGSYSLWSAAVKVKAGCLELKLEASNLADQVYSDVPDAVMPGRWVTLSMNVVF